MDEKPTYKTFEEFWGELLLVRFHEGSDHFQRYNAQRVEMVFRYLTGNTTPRILDLGCGSGDLDLCLADKGAEVTGVDRIGSVLEGAQAKVGTRNVRFVTSDLAHLSFPASSFDAILLFGLAGLMSREQDAGLLARCYAWLKPGGTVLIDIPKEPEKLLHEWTRAFEDGSLTFRSEYNPASRMIHMQPTFRTNAGETIELHDPYDATLPGDQSGVWRYHYSVSEMLALLASCGFTATEEEHCSPIDHYLLAARRAA